MSDIKNPSGVKLHPSWLENLEDEFSKEYMIDLKSFLVSELKTGKKIFPRPSKWFTAFNATPFHSVKVVIIGQDPYHTDNGAAMGLSFSVPAGNSKQPSLKNILKELSDDLDIPEPSSGNLKPWTRQGVLLLNSVLTVEKGRPGSHSGKGWETFTDRVVDVLNERRENLVFILWGRTAKEKASQLDRRKHCVISSSHPSPKSADSGFFGSKPFSRTNIFLTDKGIELIDWKLD